MYSPQSKPASVGEMDCDSVPTVEPQEFEDMRNCNDMS